MKHYEKRYYYHKCIRYYCVNLKRLGIRYSNCNLMSNYHRNRICMRHVTT